MRSRARNLRNETRVFARSWPLRRQIGHKNRFVLYARSRSGGTLLIDLLNAHPQIQCEKHAVEAELMLQPWLFPYHYAENKAVLGSAPTYGFKLKPEELLWFQRIEAPIFLREMHRRGWKIIHLQRHNIFRQAVSAVVAMQTDVYHHRQKDGQQIGRRNREKVRIAPEHVMYALRFMEERSAIEKHDLSDLPHLSLGYETDLKSAENQNDAANRVFDFLGLPPHRVQTEFLRTSSDDLHDTIENADEIIDCVRGTQYERFIAQS